MFMHVVSVCLISESGKTWLSKQGILFHWNVSLEFECGNFVLAFQILIKPQNVCSRSLSVADGKYATNILEAHKFSLHFSNQLFSSSLFQVIWISLILVQITNCKIISYDTCYKWYWLQWDVEYNVISSLMREQFWLCDDWNCSEIRVSFGYVNSTNWLGMVLNQCMMNLRHFFCLCKLPYNIFIT